MSKVVFTLPLPPSVNGAYRNVPGKGRVKTTKAKEWYREAALEIMVQRVGQRLPLTGEVAVNIQIAPHARGDLDNRIKAILDLCTNLGVWEDDKQVARILIERSRAALPISGCAVLIEEISRQRQDAVAQEAGRAASD